MSIASRAKQKANDPTDEEKRRDYWAGRRNSNRRKQFSVSSMFAKVIAAKYNAKLPLP